MTNQTEKQIEDLAKKAIEIISTTQARTSFILRKKMDALATAEKLTGAKIDKEFLEEFWNIVGGQLAYVKPETLSY